MKLGAIITNENLSEQGALGATEDALKAAETAVDVAEGNVEVIEGVEEIDNMDTGIEDAFAAEKQVENLLDAAEETMKDGGMSDKEAKLLEITHESIMASIGMSHRHTNMSKNPVVSMESYVSSQTRKSATMVTIESLKGSGATIIKNIVAALKAAVNTVANFVAGLMRNRAIMAKHLSNLEGKVKAIDTTKHQRAKETFKTAAQALSVDGKASYDTAMKVVKGATDLVLAASHMSAHVNVSESVDKAGAAIKEAAELVKHVTHGRTLKVEENDGIVTVAFTEGKAADEIHAPTKDEMGKLLTEAKNALEELRKFEKVQTKFKDGVNSIIKRLEEVKDVVRSKFGDDASKAQHSEAADVKKKARQARAVLSKAGGTLPGAAFAAIKATADYVTAGVNNYKSNGENKDDKK